MHAHRARRSVLSIPQPRTPICARCRDRESNPRLRAQQRNVIAANSPPQVATQEVSVHTVRLRDVTRRTHRRRPLLTCRPLRKTRLRTFRARGKDARIPAAIFGTPIRRPLPRDRREAFLVAISMERKQCPRCMNSLLRVSTLPVALM